MKSIAIPKVEKGSLVQSDRKEDLTPALKNYIVTLAREYNLPVCGITILGGKPYVNVTGLDAKIKEKEETKGWDFVDVELQEIQRAGSEVKDRRAGYKASVVYFDTKGFQIALKSKNEITEGGLDKLKQIFTHRYSDEGWASIDSIKMSTLHTIDHVNMMASRRATNRAKRQAIGCGLTSVDEMGTDINGITMDAEFTETMPILEGQKNIIKKLSKDNEMVAMPFLKKYNKEKVEDLTKTEAEEMIKEMRKGGANE